MSGVSVEHPSWCDRSLCTATDLRRSGFHRSRVAILDPDPRTDLGVTVQLGQGTPIPGYRDSGTLLVDLTVHPGVLDPTDSGEEYTLILPADRASALGHLLVAAGRETVTGW